MESEETLTWSGSFAVAPPSRTPKLSGDKILLPQSALEQLIAAAPVKVTEASRPLTTNFDPFNPYTFAAERAARAQFEERQPQLPHPLTFRLVNPDNGRVIYAGIREFSAGDGEVVLSASVREALGVRAKPIKSKPVAKDADVNMDETENEVEEEAWGNITVHANQLPKGTFVKLRPLEAGYDPEDWKSLLEQHMRSNYTTLTKGEVLVVPGGHGVGKSSEEYRFLIDEFKPDVDGICVVDTDLEVDIEALNEEQARETLARIVAKSQKAPGTNAGSSIGGTLELMKTQEGQVLGGEYVDYTVPSWMRTPGVEIELNGVEEDSEVDLYVSPFAPRQRVRPREEEYLFGETSGRYPKRIRISPTNVELENAEALYVSVHAFASLEGAPGGTATPSPNTYTIKVSPFDSSTTANGHSNAEPEVEHSPDDVQCNNCKQWVPKGRLVLHENFCLRNNILCPQGCDQVFQKRSPEWAAHWHCPHDSSYGNTALSKSKHDHLAHTPQTCSSCDKTYASMKTLAAHRTTVCPGKLHLCQFCHLEVPQEGDPDVPNAEALLSGLTVHELIDGGRTTECHLCGKITRLRDMRVHLAAHEMEKKSKPEPRVCRNALCGRTLDGASHTGDTRAGTRMGNGPGNDIRLCSTCYGPLYSHVHDPENRALRRRVERRYLTQFVTGCGKPGCKNEYCKAGRKNLGLPVAGTSMKDALPMVKPLLEGLNGDEALHFCTDEKMQQRRGVAEMMAAETGLKGEKYAFNWCIAALEAEGGKIDLAREWLKNWAPMRGF